MNQSFSFPCSLDEMEAFAKRLAKRCHIFPEGGNIILLNGEMGAGKTTFSRAFAQYFDIESSSPTYSIIESYTNTQLKRSLIHGDFYRSDDIRSKEILEEYMENIDTNTIALFEWFPTNLMDTIDQYPIIQIDLSHGENGDTRELSITYKNPFSMSVENAKQQWKTWKTPVHVQHHIAVVTKVAVFCAQQLKKNNIPVDVEMVEASAILHDAVRYVDFPSFTEEDFARYKEEVTPEKAEFWKQWKETYKKMHHADAMDEILRKEGFCATGKVVASHKTGAIYKKEPFSWEEKCVFYGDKRGMHDHFVTIQERLTDGRRRYAHEKNPGLEEKILDMETELKTLGNWTETDIQHYMAS